MTRPVKLSPEEFEILIGRELRKLGLAPGLRVHRREPLLDRPGAYDLELIGWLEGGNEKHAVLVSCRQTDAPITRAELDALRERAGAADRKCVVFCTAGYEVDAVRSVQPGGAALLRVVDAEEEYRAWFAGKVPAWLPQHAAQLVSLGPAGEPVYTVTAANRPDLLLHSLRQESPTGTGQPSGAGADSPSKESART